jgi:hypothetical protein
MGERKSGVSADQTSVRQILLASDARVPDVESRSWLRALRSCDPGAVGKNSAVCVAKRSMTPSDPRVSALALQEFLGLTTRSSHDH